MSAKMFVGNKQLPLVSFELKLHYETHFYFVVGDDQSKIHVM